MYAMSFSALQPRHCTPAREAWSHMADTTAVGPAAAAASTICLDDMAACAAMCDASGACEAPVSGGTAPGLPLAPAVALELASLDIIWHTRQFAQ